MNQRTQPRIKQLNKNQQITTNQPANQPTNQPTNQTNQQQIVF